MDENIKKKRVNEDSNEAIEKSKSKNAIIVLVVIIISLLIVVGLIIIQQINMRKFDNDVQNNVNSNGEDNVENIQSSTVVDVDQKEQNKEEQQVEQDKNEQDVTSNKDTTESKQPEKEVKEQVKVDFEEIADQLFKELGVKEDLDKLPELTDEERPQYEEEWNKIVVQENENVVKIIKDKYPSLSGKQAQDYATQMFEYAKEYGIRIAKHNQEIIDDAKDAVESADKANAMSELNLKYVELLTQHMQTSSTPYEPNEQDLKILQQHVMEKSENKYTVKITADRTGYEIVKKTN